MKKLTSTLPNMVLSLGIITAFAGALLGAVYALTEEPIARQAKADRIAAISEVAPPFSNNPDADAATVTLDGADYTVYPAIKDGRLVGAAVMTSSMNGFGGEIDVMAGFDADGTLRDYRVIKHAETPGLGSKMELWFRDPAAARSVIEKNPSKTHFYVTKDKEQHGEIDAITAATISSRAFLESLRHAYDAYREYSLQNDGENLPKAI